MQVEGSLDALPESRRSDLVGEVRAVQRALIQARAELLSAHHLYPELDAEDSVTSVQDDGVALLAGEAAEQAKLFLQVRLQCRVSE